jgi:hypothetical protein
MFSAIVSFGLLPYCDWDLDVLCQTCGLRDGLAMVAHDGDVAGDGFPDVLLGLFEGVADRDAAREIGDESAVAVFRPFEHYREFESLSHLSFACFRTLFLVPSGTSFPI